MNEIIVKPTYQLGVIDFDFETANARLDEKLKEYEGAVFTDESIPFAKKEVAALRSDAKSLNDARIKLKKDFSKPLDEFESKMKELVAKFDKPINLINAQIAEYEEKKKQEKKANIVEFFNTLSPEFRDIVALDSIYDSKWENATTSMKSIKDELEQLQESTLQAISTIKGMNSEATEKALDIYKSTLSLSDAITYVNQYEQQKIEIMRREEERRKAEIEREKQAEIERIRREERARIAEEERIKEEERKKVLAEEEAKKQAEKEALAIKQEEQGERLINYQFVVTCYPSELEQIEMYLSSIGIEFERTDV